MTDELKLETPTELPWEESPLEKELAEDFGIVQTPEEIGEESEETEVAE